MSTTPPIPTINTSDDITPGPFSEHELRIRWNEQADEFNQWESLDLSEQLAWAQSCAIAADRKIHPVVDPVPVGRPWPIPGDAEGLAEVFWGNYDQFDPEARPAIEAVSVNERPWERMETSLL